jgi:predicted nucleic acid-binding protein
VAIVPVDSRVAEIHAFIVAKMAQAGITIGPHDNWIAATAIACDYPLLTTNAHEFQRVPNLQRIDYVDP